MLFARGLLLSTVLVVFAQAAVAAESKPVVLHFELGEQVLVEWNNRWWRAKVTNIRKNRYQVHYIGASKKWDEWIKLARIAKSCD